MVKSKKASVILFSALAVFFTAGVIFTPVYLLMRRESYVCVFGGREEILSYADAYSMLYGIGETGDILLNRDGEMGTVKAGDDMKRTRDILEGDDLGDLIKNEPSLTPLESAALFRLYGDRLYLDGGEYFSFNGTRVSRCALCEAETVVLLGGDVPRGELAFTKARTLEVRPRAALSAAALIGSAVVKAVTHPPYGNSDAAVYLDTPGGRRLIAGLPLSVSVTVECDFCDAGALLPCDRVESLTLAFVGNSREMLTDFHGELGYLFLAGTEYRVPASLKRVKVTGGYLVSHAFYGCDLLEVDACGVKAENIAEDAFADLKGLSLLHTPRRDVILSGQFGEERAPCGCYVYRRYE